MNSIRYEEKVMQHKCTILFKNWYQNRYQCTLVPRVQHRDYHYISSRYMSGTSISIYVSSISTVCTCADHYQCQQQHQYLISADLTNSTSDQYQCRPYWCQQ